jgi:hypothetical protein
MRWNKTALRWLLFVVTLVAVIAGGVGIYRQIINPKYLVIQGVKIPTKRVYHAYYQLHPEALNQKISKKNAIEAFLLKQNLFEDYLKRTAQQWISGIVIDVQDGFTVDENDENKEKVKRFVIETETGFFSVYTQSLDIDIKLGQKITVQLGSEFSELSNFNQLSVKGERIPLPFSSVIIDYHHL